MNRILRSLCAICLLVTLLVAGATLVPSQAAARSGELSAEKTDYNISSQDGKMIDITYDNPTSSTVRSFEFEINYDPAVVQVESISPDGITKEINNTNGKVTYSTLKTIDPNSAGNVILTLTVSSSNIAQIGDSSNITFKNVEVLSQTTNEISTTTMPTSITVTKYNGERNQKNNSGSVHLSNVSLQPDTVSSLGSHNLTFTVSGVSADNQSDIININLPNSVTVVKIIDARSTDSNYGVNIRNQTDPIKLAVNPNETANTISMEIKVMLHIKASES